MSVVGTAGHVDHGKSMLLKAITGRDPDRWEEEKRRGLTIDLGFVWFTLPSGREVSFVDVPGHERFIKNMLAGIEPVDAALLVVAADDGWMPQTEEHLAILEQLGIDRAVVVVSKADRVDGEMLELVTLDVLEHLEGTGLAGSPVIPMSALTGQGLEELKDQLDAVLPPPPPPTETRLWVDRRFTITGAGTVVTGTLLGSPVAVGDSLMPFPGVEPVRVRAIESHEQSLDRVDPHRRVALNIAGESGGIERGTMLGRAGRWTMTDRLTAVVRPARYVDDLAERGAYQMHVGTAAVQVKLRSLGGQGTLIRMQRPLPLRYGDRFILRETGRRTVVGGGTVLDPDPPPRGRRLRASAALAPDLSPDEAADALLDLRGSDSVSRILAHAGQIGGNQVVVGETAVTAAELMRLNEAAEMAVDDFHVSAPLRPGIPWATLVSRLAISAELAQHVMAASPTLESNGTAVWRSGRAGQLSPEQEESWEATVEILASGGLAPPPTSELPAELEVIHEMVRRGELIRVSTDLVYLAAEADRLRSAIAGMEGAFTVAEFRDAIGVSRKHAVPILEWADTEGMTRREGDIRHAR